MTARGRAVLTLGVLCWIVAIVFGSPTLYPVAAGLVIAVPLAVVWVRITLRQLGPAERDLVEALTSDPTALRWFHAAVFRLSQSPPNQAEAAKAFAEAKRRGLTAKSVHPADLPTYRVLEAGYTPPQK